MGMQDMRILKLLLEIKQLVSSSSEVAELKKQNSVLKGEVTKLKNKLNEVK